jgi:diguanylate cyclase (GGDEF)-like protein
MNEEPSPHSTAQNAFGKGSNRRRATWEALAGSAVALVVVAAGIFGLWVASIGTIRDNYHQYLIGLAQTAASMIDPVLQTTIRRPDQLNGPDYQRAVAPLRRMHASVADVHYIYTVVQDGSKVRFVLDASVPGVGESGIEDQSGVWEIYEERDPAMLLALGNGVHAGSAAATDVPFSDKWGTFMTGWAPIFDAAGGQIGAVGVDVDARVYAARVAAAPKWALLGLLPACILIAVLGVTYYRVRLRGLDDVRAAAVAEARRKAMEAELALAARQDKLTGLPNRALFMEHLQKAVDRVRADEQAVFAVLFLDFDRFKFTNDSLGHAAGDELLRQIAARLRKSLRATDWMGGDPHSNLAGRFGGDEFLLLINDLNSPADAAIVADRLLKSLNAAYSIFDREVQSTASIGIVTSEQSALSAEEIVRNADVAMYVAKRSGGGCAVLFDEAMHTRAARHLAIETSLGRAIDGAELYLVFQPIVDLESGHMVSVEALVRWNHPVMGPISPCEFIPIAEESNLIIAVGRWVLREACLAMAEWRRTDPARAPKTIGVNVSRAELALGSVFLEQTRDTLASTGLPPECLQLEVTEREVMRNPEACLELMRELRRLGVRLAMDDFGTGTSSLGLLRDYPFDTIKIDRSFVQDMIASRDVLAVTHATIALIANLGMASLAEGVEEPSQVAVLQSLGCRYAQGHFFSRPVRADRLLDGLEGNVAAARSRDHVEQDLAKDYDAA